ncbi:DUF5719 family protein [uncultured Demequina sp.]|uniref:DUF5719 family protein n=1 Tax=uncultured Demequina sp. TaxID=693499 RepID=UPI0025E4563B|nr:DUF5719 family protein [uncultured Demequina sp.]
MRILAMVLGLIALAGAATLSSPSAVDEPGSSTLISVDPARQPLGCPGRLAIPVGAIVSGDAELDSGSTDVAYAITPDGEMLEGDLGGAAVEDSQAVAVERIGSGDIAGLAGLGCAAPERDQWLVGGSTALGASARLVLTNPTASAVRVHVDIHGPVGIADESPSVLVGPGGQEAILLEAIAPDLPAVAIHVRAEGVGISAALQDSRLDGFTAAGTDWIVAGPAATELTVPIAGPATASAPATLSLLAPDGAQASITLLTADGTQAWLDEDELELEPGVLADLRLPDVGLAAVRIEATEPVVAGLRATVARESAVGQDAVALDHAFTAGQVTGDVRERAVVVPEGDITLVAAGGDGTLVLDAGGETVEIAVTADTVASLALDFPPGTVLASDQPFSWALLLEDEQAGFLTTIEPVVTELEAREVEVGIGAYPAAP